jgi:hypothetical protein
MRDEEVINFHKLPLDKENKLKKKSWEAFGLGVFCFVICKKRKT